MLLTEKNDDDWLAIQVESGKLSNADKWRQKTNARRQIAQWRAAPLLSHLLQLKEQTNFRLFDCGAEWFAKVAAF